MKGTGFWVLPLAIATLGGCDPEPKPTAPSAAVGPSAAPTPSASAVASGPPRPPRVPAATQPGCRVLTLTGDVKTKSGPVPNGGVIYGTEWIELAKGSEISVRHTVSTRELTLRGPGVALPCLGGEEEVLLTEGVVETTAGAGARPGAEVIVFTPLGSVSFGDAQLTIRASKTKVEVKSGKGEAWIRPAKAVTRQGPEKLGGAGAKAVLTGASRFEVLIEDCEAAAGAAESLARAVLAPAATDGGTLGDRAAAHLVARRAARGACGAARAAAHGEPDADRRAGHEGRVATADRRWQSLGTPGAPAPKSSGH